MSDKELCGTTVPGCVPFDHLRDNEAYASERGRLFACKRKATTAPKSGSGRLRAALDE